MKQIYERKCSWCYFTNGKKERITQVYVRHKNPLVIVFRTKSGTYLYNARCENMPELYNVKPVVKINFPSHHFYYLSSSKELPLYEFDKYYGTAINIIEKIELIDRHLGI